MANSVQQHHFNGTTFRKLLIGKTCEDVRKYNDVKIVNTEKDIDDLSVKEEFKRWHIYNPNLAAVIMEKKQVRLNKPDE